MSAAPAAAAAAPAAAVSAAPKAGLLFGGGVLKKQASGIIDLFEGAGEAEKIKAVSKSSHADSFKLELAGERLHAAPKKGSQVENSAKVSFAQRAVSLELEGKASGSASGSIAIQDAVVKGLTAKAGVDYAIADRATTLKSTVDYKNDLLTSSAAFKFPLGSALEADLSVVAKKSGVTVGGRVLANVTSGGAVGVADFEVAAGVQRDAVQVAAAVTEKASRVSLGVGVDLKDKTRVAAAVSLDVNNKYKPSAFVGGSFQVNATHKLRALATIPSGDVALILASQLHADLKTTVTGSYTNAKKQVSVGLGVELSHSD